MNTTTLLVTKIDSNISFREDKEDVFMKAYRELNALTRSGKHLTKKAKVLIASWIKNHFAIKMLTKKIRTIEEVWYKLFQVVYNEHSPLTMIICP